MSSFRNEREACLLEGFKITANGARGDVEFLLKIGNAPAPGCRRKQAHEAPLTSNLIAAHKNSPNPN